MAERHIITCVATIDDTIMVTCSCHAGFLDAGTEPTIQELAALAETLPHRTTPEE